MGLAGHWGSVTCILATTVTESPAWSVCGTSTVTADGTCAAAGAAAAKAAIPTMAATLHRFMGSEGL